MSEAPLVHGDELVLAAVKENVVPLACGANETPVGKPYWVVDVHVSTLPFCEQSVVDVPFALVCASLTGDAAEISIPSAIIALVIQT